jgi:mannose-6-phosphate isomerase-like protein (cupin superfamily)
MRMTKAGWLTLGLMATTTVISLAAQGGGRGAPAPVPLSTTKYDLWTTNQLSTPTASLGNYGNHTASIQRRDVGAAPETHTGYSHVLIFTSGEGNFIVGGDIVAGADGKRTIQGGDTHKIVLGEIYHIPINTPHQVVPNAGSSVTYFITNINIVAP